MDGCRWGHCCLLGRWEGGSRSDHHRQVAGMTVGVASQGVEVEAGRNVNSDGRIVNRRGRGYSKGDTQVGTLLRSTLLWCGGKYVVLEGETVFWDKLPLLFT